jgi:uncharacterized coiled-coil DUF342 family protein
MKDRFDVAKEKSKVVDELKVSISKFKEEMVPLRLKTNMIHGKMTDYKGILSTTNDSIKNYQIETVKIAKKVQKLINKKDKAQETALKLKDSVLHVFKEVSEF